MMGAVGIQGVVDGEHLDASGVVELVELVHQAVLKNYIFIRFRSFTCDAGGVADVGGF